jgi:hypothetical protein
MSVVIYNPKKIGTCGVVVKVIWVKFSKPQIFYDILMLLIQISL